MSNASSPPPVQPATLRPRELWVLLNLSRSAFYRDLAGGIIPEGFRLGKSRRWLRTEIEAWLAAGAPKADAWKAMQRQSAGKRR